MPDESPIDPEAIENLRALNPDDGDGFLRDIVGIFLEDTPARIAELRESLATADNVRFVRAAHSIKGSASNLGANHLRVLAGELENSSKANGLGGVEPAIAELDLAFQAARIELEKLL